MGKFEIPRHDRLADPPHKSVPKRESNIESDHFR